MLEVYSSSEIAEAIRNILTGEKCCEDCKCKDDTTEIMIKQKSNKFGIGIFSWKFIVILKIWNNTWIIMTMYTQKFLSH